MEIIDEKETLNYVGGAKISVGIATVLVGAISFILGIIDGYTNAKVCRR